MKHVVIGGGIAGVSCVEELCRLQPKHEVTLISSSTVLKGVDAVIKITRTIEEVLVTEKDLASLQYPNLRVLQAVVESIDTGHKVVHLQSGERVSFDKLCICLGAQPKVLGYHHDRIITLRDTQSIQDFARQLTYAKRIAVVGNGGIALELIGAVCDVEVVWVAKHGHIGDAFFDVDAAEFMLGVLQHQQQIQGTQQQDLQQHIQPPTHHKQRQRQQAHELTDRSPPPGAAAAAGAISGHAAGPKWVNQLPKGRLPPHVKLEKDAVVTGVSSIPNRRQSASVNEPSSTTNGRISGCDSDQGWPLYLQLSNGDEVGVDLVVQAIGVEPATNWLPKELRRAPDAGILVNADLESSIPGIYAAGDCCTVDPAATAQHWFQMRLWTQARLMGCHAAAAMTGMLGSEVFSFSFELFTHVTRFLGKKVVLLGLYNGQKLQQEPAKDIIMYTRVLDEGTGQATFVRVLLLRGRMQGAVLIGETDLEETFENLILDGLDLSDYGPELLDLEIELDHVFD